VRKAANYVYHLACFNCDICFRQLNTGEQFIINSQSNESSPLLSPSSSAAAASVADNQVCTDQGRPIRLMCRLHFTVENFKQYEEAHTANVSEQAAADYGDDQSPNTTMKANKSNESHSSIKQHFKQRQQRHHQQTSLTKSEHFHLLTTPSSAASSSSSSINNNNQSHHVHQETTDSTLNLSLSSATQPTIAAQLSMSKEFSMAVSSPTSSSNHLAPVDENNFLVGQHHRIPSSNSTASSSTTSSSSTTTLGGCTSGGGGGAGGPMSPGSCTAGLQSKSKRVRTTFTEDQLSILQTHFQIDSNPDGQDLERIATITGLSKRVTQVWFQNSRARQKKYMIKKKPSHASLAASSMGPVNHVSHHHNHGQHHANQNMAPINRTINSQSADVSSPSPNLEPNNSPICRPIGLDGPNKIQASFGGYTTHQFRDMGRVFNVVAPQIEPKLPTRNKENESVMEIDMDMERDQRDQEMTCDDDDEEEEEDDVDEDDDENGYSVDKDDSAVDSKMNNVNKPSEG
jgi:hypothetical protein